MKSRSHALTALLALCLAACSSGGHDATVGSGKSCPLSPAEQREAVADFSAMMPAIAHPRCANCHGGFDVFSPSAKQLHGGGQIDETTVVDSSSFKTGLGPVSVSHKKDFTVCQDCHDVPTWAQPASNAFFARRSPVQICQQFKANGDPTFFRQHVQHDPLVLAGFVGRRGQHDLKPEPPPITHAEFQKAALDWARLVSDGHGWKGGTSNCGCVVDVPRMRITEHIRESSDRYGVERDITYVADLAVDSTGDYTGTGTYTGTLLTYKVNCFNSAPDDRKEHALQGHLTASASEISLGSKSLVSYELDTTDWPPELTLLGTVGDGPNGAPTQDDIDAAHHAGSTAQLMLKLTGQKTVIHKHTVDDGTSGTTSHVSGCVKQATHDDDITIQTWG